MCTSHDSVRGLVGLGGLELRRLLHPPMASSYGNATLGMALGASIGAVTQHMGAAHGCQGRGPDAPGHAPWSYVAQVKS